MGVVAGVSISAFREMEGAEDAMVVGTSGPVVGSSGGGMYVHARTTCCSSGNQIIR